MFTPRFITFTGADDRTDLAQMAELASDFPVEFAILFSGSREGSARYPGRDWIAPVQRSGLRLAAHICGAWASQIVTEGRSDIDDRLDGFSRVQINTAADLDIDLITDWANKVSLRNLQEIEVILQCRGPFPEDDRVSWLYDCSAGTGTQPDTWPEPPKNNIRFGYAGGMGPENIASILETLPETSDAWIDMESRVRNDRDLFDLDLCRSVCSAAYPETAPSIPR